MTWHEHYDKLLPTLDDGLEPIPLYGLRMCVYVGENGLPGVRWKFDNYEHADLMQMVGYMTALRNQVILWYLGSVDEIDMSKERDEN